MSNNYKVFNIPVLKSPLEFGCMDFADFSYLGIFQSLSHNTKLMWRNRINSIIRGYNETKHKLDTFDHNFKISNFSTFELKIGPISPNFLNSGDLLKFISYLFLTYTVDSNKYETLQSQLEHQCSNTTTDKLPSNLLFRLPFGECIELNINVITRLSPLKTKNNSSVEMIEICFRLNCDRSEFLYARSSTVPLLRTQLVEKLTAASKITPNLYMDSIPRNHIIAVYKEQIEQLKSVYPTTSQLRNLTDEIQSLLFQLKNKEIHPNFNSQYLSLLNTLRQL